MTKTLEDRNTVEPRLHSFFAIADYFDSVGRPARAIRDNKRGTISAWLPSIVLRLSNDLGGALTAMRLDGERSLDGARKERFQR